MRCPACELVYADPASHLTLDDEKARYQQHRNSPSDAGYRRFLSRMVSALAERLGPGQHEGLDYGSGPNPVLSLLLAGRGHRMSVFDPLFSNVPGVLDRQYDFVTCTEVVEHFKNPTQEWDKLIQLVKPGGWLGIMTKLADDVAGDPEAFARWHYIRDLTHVSFFSRKTFRHLAKMNTLEVEFVGEDIVMLRKP